MTAPPNPTIHRLGLREYRPIWQRMREFTQHRDATTTDQIWLLQHPPVFTQGSSCQAQPRAADIDTDTAAIGTDTDTTGIDTAAATDIPLVRTDRGGQITYHGPGQLIAYLLLDLKRRQLGPKALVARLEQVIIDLLAAHGVPAARRPGAPGVYVAGAKIAALGLRIKRGCCFHGLSLNVAMDLRPYTRIDPCGYPDLAITQLTEHAPAAQMAAVEDDLATRLTQAFTTPMGGD